MLEVKKCGKTEYGFWAIGLLKYKGLEIRDIFSVSKELEKGKSYEVDNIVVSRNSKGIFKIKLEIL